MSENICYAVPLSDGADQVWQLVGGFDSLPNWMPHIAKGELSDGSRIRRLANLQGDVIVERLEVFDTQARSYSYSIVQSPFPVTDYLSTLSVQPNASGCRLAWYASFTPSGAIAAEVAGQFSEIFDGGLKAVAKRVAGREYSDI